MLYTQKTLKALEYDKITKMLASCAATDGAKAMALSLSPADDYELVIKKQACTRDAKKLISTKGYPHFFASEDVIPSAEKAEKGASLSTRELLNIASLFACARMLDDYYKTNRNYTTVLDEIFSRLMMARDLENKINKAIVSEDIIADEATPELAEIRRKIKAANNKIKDTLHDFVSGQRSKYLQENIITMRDGRYVIPVKSEYRNEIKGLLHDTSTSGATVFIEPMGVVEANNEIRELKCKEENEIARILAILSAECANVSTSIKLDYYNITEIAFYFACATLAVQMKADEVSVVEEPVVCLKRARHPLIPHESVVPIDIELGKDFDTLIITGPNTGGKTVALKTIALFALMIQSGLQIPSDQFSQMGIFSEVLVDIGDDQSIEQSLSTFSSHMVTVIDIISKVTSKSLVIFDELGAGTDPVEGAALAVSIVEAIRKKGATVALTTHYAELKAYALETEGVQNASCEFDVNTLRPTYKLIIGMPGKSNAFAISEKLGLPAEIVHDAGARISGDNRRFEYVLEQLEKTRIEMEENREQSEKLRIEYENFKTEAEKKIREKTAESENEIKKLREKSKQLIDSARATSEFVFKELEAVKKKQESKNFAAELAKARQEVRDRLNQATDQYYDFETPEYDLEDDYVLPRPLKIGDKVYLVDFKQEGEVLELPNKNGVFAVRAGILKTKTDTTKVRLIEGNKQKKPKPKNNTATVVKRQTVPDFKPEIDVRGMTGEEAWSVIDKYLDDAIMASMHSVRIIHGKGTGALRQAVQSNLRTDKRVSSYRHGEFGEGDFGVTVAELK